MGNVFGALVSSFYEYSNAYYGKLAMEICKEGSIFLKYFRYFSIL